MNKQQKPRLRFKGFTGEWECRKLGEIGSTFGGLTNKSREDFGHGDARYITYMNVYQNALSSKHQLDSIEIDVKQNEVKKGDVLFTTSSETPEEVGMSSVWAFDINNVYLNSFCFGYRLNKQIDLNYLAYCLRSDYIRSQMILLAQGISRYNISKKGVMEIEILIPTSEEQTQIGNFFRRLDSQIAESCAVLEKSRQLKKAMLVKMFPTNGEKIPKIRFKGFEEEWECKKLGELCTITTGKLDANAMTENGKYDFFTSGIKKYKIDHYAFIGPAITIAGNGATVGYMHYADGYFNAYQRTYVLTGIQANRNFIFSEINQKLRNKIKQESRAGNIPYIVLDMLTELSIDIPTIEEQTAIGNFFRQLDETIALQSAEVEKLNQLKKGLLAAMLV